MGGGARAVLKPINTTLSQNDMNDLVSVTSSRLNAFGISDVSVRGVSDLEGNKFLMVEVAGMTRDDLKEVVAQQGKFEAKIGMKPLCQRRKRYHFCLQRRCNLCGN